MKFASLSKFWGFQCWVKIWSNNKTSPPFIFLSAQDIWRRRRTVVQWVVENGGEGGGRNRQPTKSCPGGEQTHERKCKSREQGAAVQYVSERSCKLKWEGRKGGEKECQKLRQKARIDRKVPLRNGWNHGTKAQKRGPSHCISIFQCRASLTFQHMDISSSLQEHLDKTYINFPYSFDQRRYSIFIFEIHIGSCVDEKLDDISFSIVYGRLSMEMAPWETATF